jgi:hypothetical protein
MNQRQIVGMLQNLLFSENKAAELRPIDIALLTYLILRQTDYSNPQPTLITCSGAIPQSHTTIAAALIGDSDDRVGYFLYMGSWGMIHFGILIAFLLALHFASPSWDRNESLDRQA